MDKMEDEERAVAIYLLSSRIGCIEYEPIGKYKTPDFSIDSKVGVEVRRLNQTIPVGERNQGLEEFEIPLKRAITEVLESFNNQHFGSTYYVSVFFMRSSTAENPKDDIKHIKKLVKSKLDEFLSNPISVVDELPITEYVSLGICEASPRDGRLFRLFLSLDDDWGGEVISQYANAINNSIIEKSKKIKEYLNRYNMWWLFLVDHLGGIVDLDKNEIDTIKDSISSIGHFHRVCLIDFQGEKLLLDITKDMVVD